MIINSNSVLFLSTFSASIYHYCGCLLTTRPYATLNETEADYEKRISMIRHASKMVHMTNEERLQKVKPTCLEEQPEPPLPAMTPYPVINSRPGSPLLSDVIPSPSPSPTPLIESSSPNPRPEPMDLEENFPPVPKVHIVNLDPRLIDNMHFDLSCQILEIKDQLTIVQQKLNQPNIIELPAGAVDDEPPPFLPPAEAMPQPFEDVGNPQGFQDFHQLEPPAQATDQENLDEDEVPEISQDLLALVLPALNAEFPEIQEFNDILNSINSL